MWSTLLVLALVAGLDPIRLGWTLLVVSRPRPIQNLLAYWAGTMAVSVPYMLVPLMVLHATPWFNSSADVSTNPAVRHLQIGMGVFGLSMAALLTARWLTRRRQPAPVPTSSGNKSTLVLDSDTPASDFPLGPGSDDTATEGKSVVRRLIKRGQKAWENGSLWVSFAIGVACVPPIDGALFVVAIAVTSGAAIGTKIVAAFAFVLGTLVVVEIMLVTYLVSPEKTEAVLRRLHKWALAHRQLILIGMFTAAGASALAHGIGIW